MKSIPFVILLIMSGGTLFPTDAAGQERLYLVLSPKVGMEIDSLEAGAYKLFRSFRSFQYARVFQTIDKRFWIEARQGSENGIPRDSVFEITGKLVLQYAERIDHYDELARGTYFLGSSTPFVVYEDGTPLSIQAKRTMSDSGLPLPPDQLPLAQNAALLPRPMFPTIHVDFGIGYMNNDCSSLSPLGAGGGGFAVPVCLLLHVPFSEEFPLSFRGGVSFALGGSAGGSLTSICAVLLYQSNSWSSVRPVIGFGVARTAYDFSGPVGGVGINASQSYPILILGINVVHNIVDIQYTIPLYQELETSFESNQYKIRIVGPELDLVLSI